MRRVFIPNRGEIAVRIVNACHGLGLECVVGASEPDMDGLAARTADRAVCIGPGPATQSYLKVDAVVHAALSTRCDAIHPGYGFLSESPALAERAREHGVTFVGPSAKTMKLAGDKLAARREAAQAGAPVLPGGEVTNPEQARALAKQIGYPLLVKAAGGGGGRGIKRVEDDDELDSLISLARSEAGSAFGDDRVYLEKLIEAARHVEVQIAADEHSTVLHLGERDCTVQRRFQKVVEEALAPQLSDATRRRLQQAAVAFAERIGYLNLGTAEFVIDAATGDPYFLEMNCRIQVEHPVTEAITYLDLVQMQLQIAARPAARDRAGRRLLPRPRDRMPAQRGGPEPWLSPQPRHPVAVRGAPARRPSRGHALPGGNRRPALLRLPAGQVHRARCRPRARDRDPHRGSGGPRR